MPGTAQAQVLAADALRGLTAVPKRLPPKWFYDRRGSELFEAITELPEYYLTRAEREILTTRAPEIARIVAPHTVLELGAGSAKKTRLLLDELVPAGTSRYVPFDVSQEALAESAAAVARDHPGLVVEPIVGDFQHDLGRVAGEGPTLVVFLGSTIGNLLPPERRRFLRGVRELLEPGEWLLLGVDLVKEKRRLVAAYDDAAGVTAAFNRNVLTVLNRELGADFSPERFEHVALWDDRLERIEMRLRSCGLQRVHIPVLETTITFRDGEEMRTEVSAKFRLERIGRELGRAGLPVLRSWTDDAGDYAVVLASAA